EGYFDSLPGIVMSRIKAEAAESAEEEMQVISPLLAGLPKKPVYSVPEGYFENLEIPILPRQAPVRRLHFWRYAAAAVVAGLIALAVWFAAMPPAESPALAGTSAVNGSGAILEKVATVSDAEIESFLG